MITTLNKIEHIALDAFISYLEKKRWKHVAYDDPRRIVFALDANDGYAPYLIALPASEEYSDYEVRIAEMVDRLAGVEDRTAQDVVASIVNPPFFVARLPLPPGVNESYKIITIETKEGKKAHTLAATKVLENFKEEAAWRLIAQRGKQNWNIIHDIANKKRKRVHVALKATITFYVKSLWRSDLDGFVKAAQDAAFTSMGVNDNLVTKLDLEKTLVDDDEYCEMTVMIRDVDEYRRQCENEGKRRKRQKVAS